MGAYLERPNTEKETESGGNAYLRHGASAMQGWRKKMEDAHITEPDLDVHGQKNVSLYAVFDGHGGAACAQFASEEIPKLVRTHLARGLRGRGVRHTALLPQLWERNS